MSDKKLLEEGTIRRFQTLANIKSLGSAVLEEKKMAKKPEHKEEKEEKKVEESMPDLAGQRQVPMEEEGAGMAEAGVSGGMASYEEEKMEEAEGGMEGGEESEVRAALEEIKSGVDKLLAMIEGAGGMSMDVEAEEEGGEESGEEEMGAAGEEEKEEMKYEESLEEKKDAKGHKGMKKEEEKEEEKEDESLEEALAEELTRRVAARLMREAKKGAAAWGKGTFKSAAVPKKGKGSATKTNWGTKKGAKGHA
jgi:hypothetical protein